MIKEVFRQVIRSGERGDDLRDVFNYLGAAYDMQCIIGTRYSLINCLHRLIRLTTVNQIIVYGFDP